MVAYELPVFLPTPLIGRGQALRVWGRVRPAAARGTVGARVAVQFRSGTGGRFDTLTVAVADRGRGFLDVHVRVPASGQVRLAWVAPTGDVVFSRASAVLVR
jgi:hypothetical protein